MFTVGKRVRVRPDLNPSQLRDDQGIRDDQGKWPVTFVYGMDKTLDQVGTIVNVNEYGVMVDFDNPAMNSPHRTAKYWVYSEHWLTLCSNEVTIMEED
jgi:hypothetical protein